MKWNKVIISINNIEAETDKAVLIKMKHNSNYDGFVFWHPAKLVRAEDKMFSFSFSFNEKFTFNLKKYGKGKYNKFDVIDEIEIDADEMLEEWNVK